MEKVNNVNQDCCLKGSNFIVLNNNKKIYGNSLSLFLFGQGCCGLEVFMPYYEANNLNISVKNSPKHCDVLVISGEITNKAAPVLRKVYDEMPFPKWVISIGECANCCGIYSSYALTKGAEKIVPVDIKIIGCPPKVETIMEAFKFITTKGKE